MHTVYERRVQNEQIICPVGSVSDLANKRQGAAVCPTSSVGWTDGRDEHPPVNTTIILTAFWLVLA